MALKATRVPQADSGPAKLPWSLRWRLAASLLLLIHLAAVFIGPFTFATSVGPGIASPFAAPIRELLRPYLELAFLDHGYFFFAPNPGPSHLLRARLEFNDGRPPSEITLPDRGQHWPRLLYHRHFMLAEQYHADFAPAQPPPEVAPGPAPPGDWRGARDMYELKKRSFEQHLRRVYGADRVTLTRVEHVLIPPTEYTAAPRSISAVNTYVELSETLDPAEGAGARP
jgi:hypothetical protein